MNIIQWLYVLVLTPSWIKVVYGDCNSTSVSHKVNSSDMAYSLFATDINGNGAIDLAYVSESGIGWSQNNNGDGSLWTNHEVDNTISAFSVRGIDIDGDDAIDLAYAFENGIGWLENNNGDGSLWTNHKVYTDVNDAYSVFAIDIDGDSNTDLVSASGISVGSDCKGHRCENKAQKFTIKWHANNDGDGLSWTSHEVYSGVNDASSIFGIDIDGDGDIDIASACSSYGIIAWHENNDGSGLSWTYHEVHSGDSDARSVFGIDIDGDGDIDLASASLADGTISWHENNDGSGLSWTYHEVYSNSYYVSSIFGIDIDGDGDIDLASSILPYGYVESAAWYENNGNGSSWTHHEVNSDGYYAYSIFPIDIDGDNDIDLAYSTLDVGVVWEEMDYYGCSSTHASTQLS